MYASHEILLSVNSSDTVSVLLLKRCGKKADSGVCMTEVWTLTTCFCEHAFNMGLSVSH